MGTSLLSLGWPFQTCYACSGRRESRLVVYARKQAKGNNKQQANQPADRRDSTQPRIVIEALEQELPQAPSPSSRAPRQQEALSPGEIYPVFAPKPGSLAAADGPWRWEDEDEDGRGTQRDDATTSRANVPPWNPRTGFMRTAAEVQAEAAAAAAAASSTAGTQAESAAALTSALKSDYSSPPLPLPAISRNVVLSSALGTGFWMAVIAVFVRNYAALNSAAAMGTDPAAVEVLLRWPAGFESLTDVAVAVGAAAAVTGTRLALLAVWRDLREATDLSNQQVLSPLGSFDILLVAAASGIPEELLFRGALLPATFPDWRGLLLAAALFGVLHNTGGRNPAFAAWAAAVGALYGGAFLLTGNVWVPALAHTAANAASAFIWQANRAKKPPTQPRH